MHVHSLVRNMSLNIQIQQKSPAGLAHSSTYGIWATNLTELPVSTLPKKKMIRPNLFASGQDLGAARTMSLCHPQNDTVKELRYSFLYKQLTWIPEMSFAKYPALAPLGGLRRFWELTAKGGPTWLRGCGIWKVQGEVVATTFGRLTGLCIEYDMYVVCISICNIYRYVCIDVAYIYI